MAAVESADNLAAEFQRIHRRLRRVALITGAAWSAAAGLGLCLLIGWIDWRWHVDSPGARAALAVAGGLVWIALFAWQVVLPFISAPDPVATARRIERLRPHWRGALASSVEFLETRCRPEIGAPALQASVIARSQAALSAADVEPLLRVRGMRVATTCAFVAGIVAAATACLAPGTTGIALERMLLPAQARPWPRQHLLILLDASFQPIVPNDPTKPVAIGEKLRLYVDDVHAELPAQVTLQLETPDGEVREQPLERTTIAGNDGLRREIGVVALAVRSPKLRIRAIGGDDDRMPWHTFEFATRPAVRQFRMRLTPPAYTGQPAGQTVSANGDLAALVGTQVRIDAELEMPVHKAEFQPVGLAPTMTSLSDDGRFFSIEFPIPSATGGTYAINLVSRDGLKSRDHTEYRVEGIIDREPAVSLTLPDADLTVTSRAEVPIRIDASDDLGLAYLRLSAAEPPGSAGEHLRPLPLESTLPREARIDTTLQLADFALEPGRRLVVRAEAADAYNLQGLHVVRSAPRTMTIVNAEEKLRELIARQSAIAETLAQALAGQDRAWQQTRQLQLQWQTTSQFTMSDIDSLRRMALEQAQAINGLREDEHGGLPQVRRILAEFEWNGLDDHTTVERLRESQHELERLDSEIAPPLNHSASLAVRMATTDAGNATIPVGEILAELEDRQSTAHAMMAALVDRFSDWRRRHDLMRSVGEIATEQAQLSQETKEAGRRTLATPFSELPPDDRAELARIAQRQEQIARRLEEFGQQLQNSAATNESSDTEPMLPMADVARALQVMDGEAISAEMERAAQLVARNSIAESVSAQQAVEEALIRLEEAVRGLRSNTPETLLRQVERAHAEAQSLRDQQAQLRENTLGMTDATDSSMEESLRMQQRGLADETSRWAERLRRERFTDVVEDAADAAARMTSASSHLGEDAVSAAADDQQAAIDRLHSAQQSLAQKRKELEFDRTLLEWTRVLELLEALVQRQAAMCDESGRLLDEQRRHDGLSRSQMRAVLALGRAQAQLADDVAQLAAGNGSSAVVQQALADPVQSMRNAATALAEPRLDDDVLARQHDSSDRLQALVADLKWTSTSTTGNRQDRDSPSASETPSNWPLAMQLKVLARLQADVSLRAAEIRAGLADDQSATGEQRELLQELADQQGQLAHLLQEVLSGGEVQEVPE